MKQLQATLNRLNKLHFNNKADFIRVKLENKQIAFYQGAWRFMSIKADKIDSLDITKLFYNF